MGDREIFGEVLKKFRNERNLTQEELADMAQVDTNTISNYERGRSLPRFDALVRLTAALQVDLKEILKEMLA